MARKKSPLICGERLLHLFYQACSIWSCPSSFTSLLYKPIIRIGAAHSPINKLQCFFLVNWMMADAAIVPIATQRKMSDGNFAVSFSIPLATEPSLWSVAFVAGLVLFGYLVPYNFFQKKAPSFLPVSFWLKKISRPKSEIFYSWVSNCRKMDFFLKTFIDLWM